LGIFSIRSLKGGLLMLHADPYAYRLLVGLVFVGFMIISNLLIRGIHGKSD